MPYTVEEREQIVASERLRIIKIIENMRIVNVTQRRFADEILSAIKKGDGK